MSPFLEQMPLRKMWSSRCSQTRVFFPFFSDCPSSSEYYQGYCYTLIWAYRGSFDTLRRHCLTSSSAHGSEIASIRSHSEQLFVMSYLTRRLNTASVGVYLGLNGYDGNLRYEVGVANLFESFKLLIFGDRACNLSLSYKLLKPLHHGVRYSACPVSSHAPRSMTGPRCACTCQGNYPTSSSWRF